MTKRVALLLALLPIPTALHAQDLMSTIMESHAQTQYNYMSTHIANLSLQKVIDRH